MFTQPELERLTDLAESILYLSTNLEKMLDASLPYCQGLGGHTKEEILGQVLALKVLANDMDLALV